MASMRNWSCLCAILFAVPAVGCVAPDNVEDLGSLTDGKGDTALPRTVEIDLAPGASKRFRITTAAFVATLDQADNVDAQLTAKHIEYSYASDVSREPHVEAIGDGDVRNWTLTVYNRGTATLEANVVIDVPHGTELGIVSDIDKTVMPPETAAGMPAPYPGIAALLRVLELRAGGAAGDVHYVTARTPDRVVDIPDWLAMYEVPAGSIDTGTSGLPWVAQPEKVKDISAIFETQAQQTFVLLGDTAQRDPEVYAEIRTKYPMQVSSIFIHKVNTTVPAARVAGMHLVDNYAEAAALAFGDELITEAEARVVMTAARDEGLVITDAEIDALIDAAR
jgi:hypothetical protein